MLATEEAPGRRAAAREARHEGFIEHILEMFDDPSNAALTMDEIATRLGINKVILYRYFGSRDGMFEQIGVRWLERAMDAFEQAMEQRPLGERIRAGVAAYLAVVREHTSSYRVIVDHSGPGVVQFVARAGEHIETVMARYSPTLADNDVRRKYWAQMVAASIFRVGDIVQRDPDICPEIAADEVAAFLQPAVYVELSKALAPGDA